MSSSLNIKWIPPDSYYRNRVLSIESYEAPFLEVFQNKLRSSKFGIFLNPFNSQLPMPKNAAEIECFDSNRLEILKWDLKGKCRDRCAEITDNEMELLEEIIQTDRCVTLEGILRRLKVLRLIDVGMTHLDVNLKKWFKNVEVLNISCNWLTGIPGKLLPRKLKMLQAYGNFLSDIEDLCEPPSPSSGSLLLYLGLGHNKLNDDCDITCLERLKHLRFIDFSANDFCNLPSLLKQLATLPHLKALALDGNPCSVSEGYKDAVLDILPKITYLDDIELTGERKNQEYDEALCWISALTFTCHRILSFHPPTAAQSKPALSKKAKKKTEKKKKKEEKIEKITKSPKRDKTSYYFEIEIPKLQSSFKSDSQQFNKKKGFRFTDPAIEIPFDGKENMKALRDTLYSQVIVKFMAEGVDGSEPKEVVNFQCSLKMLKWYEAGVDAYWDETMKKEGKLVNGSLALLKYGKPKESSKSKTKLKSDKSESTKSNKKRGASGGKNPKGLLPYPSDMTFHMGFALRRLTPEPKPSITPRVKSVATTKVKLKGKKSRKNQQ